MQLPPPDWRADEAEREAARRAGLVDDQAPMPPGSAVAAMLANEVEAGTYERPGWAPAPLVPGPAPLVTPPLERPRPPAVDWRAEQLIAAERDNAA